MTTADRLSQALVDLLDANKPHASISVRDGRDSSDIDLPTIAVDCGDPEPHSLAMPGVNRIPVSVVLRMNFGDGVDRSGASSWGDSIEQLLNDPTVVATYITASGNGVRCDYCHIPSAGTRWVDSTFEMSFSGEALVVRTS